MASHHSSHPTKRGFTLLEVMVVIALVGIIGAVSAYFSLGTYQGHAFHSDRDVLVATLQHARAQSVGNICLGSGCTDGKPHGVRVENDNFILFQGQSYATRDIDIDSVIEGDPTVTHSVSEVVFTRLSATTSSASFTLTDLSGRTSTINVSTEGQIMWTN